MNVDRIVKANCMDIMPAMLKGSVDLILTDIPYGTVSRRSGGLRKLDKGIGDILTFDLNTFIHEAVRICSGSLYIFCAWEQISAIVCLFKSYGLSVRIGVWDKTNPSPLNCEYIWLSSMEFCVFARKPGATFNGRYKKPLWSHPVQAGLHPTQKPMLLGADIIEASSNGGDIVFDPCCGSGSFLVAAKLLDRRYIGIDIDAYCVLMAKQRLRMLKKR